MASTSTQIASSTPRWRYDAFLSFYGEDTRKNFIDHLHDALKKNGILVFRDDEKLERGKYVYDELLKAIQESMYAIVVISQNYAFSRWCLIELAKIVECTKDTGLTVLPIFYHVDPFHVRNQTETFAEAFASHEKDLKIDIEMMQKWRAALSQVGNISGWHVDNGPESKVVEEISRQILWGLSGNLSNVSKDFVGIESRVEEMMTLLSKGLDDVRFLGIYGMGGIGKTTLSKAIYDRVSHQFEASCFIDGIREESRTTRGLVDLKIELISEILGERDINIRNDHRLSQVIANRLRTKKVFIVLDDVDGEDQLEALAKRHDWFGEGSRIIITSRDRHLLNRYVDDTYKVKVLNDAEALQLFSWKAFVKPHPEENYVELSKDVVSYAQGLPLALEVFGSFLYGRRMDFWISARNRLKEKPNAKILDKLKLSFDALENSEQQLFLDIACFFNESVHRDSIRHRLESLDYYSDIGIDALVDKSLLTISLGRLWMHDLLRKMGQQIVHKSAGEPGGRSRLWRYGDVLHVLKNNTGTDAVEGIVLKLPLQKHERLNVEALSKMKKLKILEISTNDYGRGLSIARDNTRTLEWHGDPSNFMLSNELCVVKMAGYPFESLPINFHPDNLVELVMPHSCMKQLWDGRKSFDKLKHIDLSDSQNLIEISDLSGISNLEKLELKHCKSLSKVHPSIVQLSNLRMLDLSYCNLLDGVIPNDLSGLSSLYSLKLSGNKFRRIPDSVGKLSHLRFLSLEDCSWLQVLPKLPLGLTDLRVKNCPSLELFYNQMDMWTSNEKLSPFDCSFVVAYIDNDGKPFKILHLHPRSPLWTEREVQTFFTVLACGPALVRSGIPEWFNYKSTNSFGSIQMHTDLGSHACEGYELFIVYQVHEPRKRRNLMVDEHESSNSRIFDGGNRNLPYFICQFQVNKVVVTEPLVLCAPGVPFVGTNGFWVYIPAIWFTRRARNRLDGGWSNLEASITTDSLNVEVKECGARVVREHDASEFYQVLNSNSPSGRKSFLDLVCANLLRVYGPISKGSFEIKSKL